MDKGGGVAVVLGGFGDALLTTIHQNVVVKFSMQVGREHAIVGADGANLVPSAHQLTEFNINAVQMRVKRLATKNTPAFRVTEGVPHNNYFTPTPLSIVGICYQPMSNGVYRVSQIGVATAITIPVFAQVAWRLQTQPTCFVVAVTIGFSTKRWIIY